MAELTEVGFEVGSQRASLEFVHFPWLRKSGVKFTQNEYVKLNYRSCSGVKHANSPAAGRIFLSYFHQS